MSQMISTLKWMGGPSGYLKIIDQTKLPHKLTYLKCTTAGQVADAIKRLVVRGAPAIGVAAAFGAYLGIRSAGDTDINKRFFKVYWMLLATRPTAVNLKWALERIRRVVEIKDSRLDIKPRVWREALNILRDDKKTCEQIGENGAKLIKNGCRILTYCNAGLLATAGMGTALAPLYIAKKHGKRFSVYSSETRPVLQGARLTIWELQKNHIPVTLVCDNMVGSLMSQNKVDMVIVGADRIVCNGDTANKIGTYQVALLAHHHRIPFYIAAPISTFDNSIKTGKDIPIEERSSDEVTHIGNTLISPRHTKVYNPAFDVTPAKYIRGYITERGVMRSGSL